MLLPTARIGIEVEQEGSTGGPTKTICVSSDMNACRTLQLLIGVMKVNITIELDTVGVF